MKPLLLSVSIFVMLVGAVPMWTARWIEGERKRTLPRDAGVVDALPECPADDSFFRYLDLHQVQLDSSPALWRPLCRKAEPPLGKVAVKSTSAESFRECREAMNLHDWRMAQCWLDPVVDFLANREAWRTFARVALPDSRGRDVLWVTTTPLAWEGHLEAEHRLWALLGLTLAVAVWALSLSRRRWIEAGLLQRNLGVVDGSIPLQLERLLLCVLPSFNIPQEVDDLRETYGELLAEKGKEVADRWYRRQLRQSLLHYIKQWSHGLMRRASERASTPGG